MKGWINYPWHVVYSALRCMACQDWKRPHACPVCGAMARNNGGTYDAWAYLRGCLAHLNSAPKCMGTLLLEDPLNARGNPLIPTVATLLTELSPEKQATGRGSDRSCVMKRTLDHSFRPLMTLVHELAQNAVAPMLPYLGFHILRLGVGQSLNQHRDYHNHPDYPNHTMKFGKYMGGSLQMLRDGQWYSYDTENQWLWFDALKVVHKSLQ